MHLVGRIDKLFVYLSLINGGLMGPFYLVDYRGPLSYGGCRDTPSLLFSVWQVGVCQAGRTLCSRA